MTDLYVHANQLTGKHFFAQIDRSVFEFTTTSAVRACKGLETPDWIAPRS